MSVPLKTLASICAAALLLAGCGKRPADQSAAPPAPQSETSAPTPETPSATENPPPAAAAGQQATAVAHLSPTKGNKATATVTFSETSGGVKVAIDAEGLSPGEHGFHIHDKGDCSAPDATSAGDHFNPGQMPHGAPDAQQRHAGDFGNLKADASGRAHTEFVDSHIAFDGPNSIIGRAALLHAKADDLKSQPAGNAGARVACGVIEAGGGAMK